MRIQSSEPVVALELPSKTEAGKKESTDVFALLLAALAGVHVNQEARIVASIEQGAKTDQEANSPNTQIEALLRALPEGTTVEQLLLNLPKESPVMGALLEFSMNSDAPLGAPEVLEVSEVAKVPTDTVTIAGETAPVSIPETENVNDVPTAEGQDTTQEQASVVLAVASINSGQPRVEQPATLTPEPQRPDSTPLPQRVEAAPVVLGDSPQVVVPAVTPALPVVSAESLQQLRTEIISFSNNPIRPMITLEVSPPEYGRVLVSAERDAQGQVTVRLVVETPAAKQAMAHQLPQAFAGATSTPTTVSVFTTEEYQEFRQEQRERNSDRNKQQRERRQRQHPHEVEFVI